MLAAVEGSFLSRKESQVMILLNVGDKRDPVCGGRHFYFARERIISSSR